MLLEALGWYLVGAGSVLVAYALIHATRTLIEIRSKKKFFAFIARLNRIKKSAEELTEKLASDKREVSEFSFRDNEGQLATVKIVVDHDMKDHPVENRHEMESMILNGEAGTLNDLIGCHKITSGPMANVQEFVFSPRAVRDMRAGGMEPDEVVIKMLKASGRMR